MDVVSAVVVGLVGMWVVYKVVFGGGLPPGPLALPLVGNLLSLEPELHTQLAALAQIHGPIMRLWLGNKLGVVISSPRLAREVLKDKDVVFANRDVPEAARVATQGHDVVWTPYGPEWRMLRKVCVVKMLNNATLQSVYHLRRSQVRRMVGRVYQRVGSPVDVGEEVFLTTLAVVTNMLWGGTLHGEEMGSEFRLLVSRMTSLLAKPNVSDFYPALARFDLQGVAGDMARIARRFDAIFDELIGKREGSEAPDFLHYLLKQELSMTHVKALLMDMVVGGSDTSSTLMEFAMAEMMKHPEVMREVEDVVGGDRAVEESDTDNLPYLRAVMKETLRLHPVLPLLVPHSPTRSCSVGGYTVPKGSRVLVNVWAIHRDPSLWDRPLCFDPQRFLHKNASLDFSGADFSYFPFGSGRRICAGVAMAERMVLFSLATLLHSFHWAIPPQSTLDLSEKFGIVLKKNTPLLAIPTPRFSNPSLYAA